METNQFSGKAVTAELDRFELVPVLTPLDAQPSKRIVDGQATGVH